jgi:hypothetical protein
MYEGQRQRWKRNRPRIARMGADKRLDLLLSAFIRVIRGLIHALIDDALPMERGLLEVQEERHLQVGDVQVAE